MFAYKWAVRDRRLQLNGFSEMRLIARRQTVWCRHFFISPWERHASNININGMINEQIMLSGISN